MVRPHLPDICYFIHLPVSTPILLFSHLLAGVKIDMTAPVIVKVVEDNSFWESTVFSINFLLPSAFQGNASEPTDSTVTLPSAASSSSTYLSQSMAYIPLIHAPSSGRHRYVLFNSEKDVALRP